MTDQDTESFELAGRTWRITTPDAWSMKQDEAAASAVLDAAPMLAGVQNIASGGDLELLRDALIGKRVPRRLLAICYWPEGEDFDAAKIDAHMDALGALKGATKYVRRAVDCFFTFIASLGLTATPSSSTDQAAD